MNFKKLIAISLLLLPFSAIAVADQRFYFKIGTGVNKINPIKIENSNFKGRIKLANSFPLIELGLGYKIDESIRVELVFTHFFLFGSNETSFNHDDNIYKTHYKSQVNSLMLNAYKDIVTIAKVTPFIGVGIGISSVKDKAEGYAVSSDQSRSFLSEPVNSKKVVRFVYKLTAGIDTKLSDNINAELSYNYFNLGCNKPKVIDGVDNIIKRSYHVHNLTLGIRYAF